MTYTEMRAADVSIGATILIGPIPERVESIHAAHGLVTFNCGRGIYLQCFADDDVSVAVEEARVAA